MPPASTDFDIAIANLVRLRVGALVIATDPFFVSRRDQLVSLAAHHAVPAIYQFREFAAAGGLMSYGTNLADWISPGRHLRRSDLQR